MSFKTGISSKRKNMKMHYANGFVERLGICDPKKWVYKFSYDEKYSVYTEIIQYFIMHGLRLCIKVDSYVAHMFYAWSFSNNKEVPTAIKNNKYLLPLITHTTLVPRLARVVTWPVPAPVAWGHHGPSNTATCPV